jgi:alpha-galactosidase
MKKFLSLGLTVALAITQLNLGILAPTLKVKAETQTQSVGTAETPPMGWNSWNKYGGNITEDLIKGMADAMVASGMKDAGYEYINLDDGWMTSEVDENGVPKIDYKKFPNGIKSLADYVHSKGLKLGIYLSNGTKTCMGLASSLLHEEATAKAFAEWGVDYLKYDWCNNEFVSQYAPDIDKIDITKGTFTASYEAEAVENTLAGGAQVVTATGTSNGKKVNNIGNNKGTLTFNKVIVPEDGTYTVKVSYINGDYNNRIAYTSVNGAMGTKHFFPGIRGNWSTVQTQAFSVDLKSGENTITLYNPMSTSAQRAEEQYSWMSDALKNSGRPIIFSLCEWGSSQPWLWGKNVGQLWRTTGDISDNWTSMTSITDQNAVLAQYAGPNGWNDPDMLEVGNGGMTTTEYRSHFSLWSIMAAPLITGNDLANMSAATKEILLNKEVLAVDQDSLGKQGVKVSDYGDQEVFAKPLANGDVAVVLFNRAAIAATISTTPQEIGIESAAAYKLRDLWSHTDMLTSGVISASVPSHGVAMYRISKAQGNEEISPLLSMSFTGDTLLETGKSGKLSATITNNGTAEVSNVNINLAGQTGWTFNAVTPVTFDKLAPGQSLSVQWTFTVPVDAQIGATSIKANMSYTYGTNYNGSLSTETAVTVPAPAPTDDAYLSDLTWTSSKVGWSTAKKDKSIDGNTIKIGGITYTKGLGLHAEAETQYYLGGNYSRFTAAVGIDSEVGSRGSVVFQVFGDGVKLYDSGIVKGGAAAKAVDVDITGVKMLKLIVTNGGDDINYDHADWASAFVKAVPAQVKLETVTSDSIDAGSSGNVTVSFTNTSLAVLKNFTANLVLPQGWSAEAQTPASFDSVEAGQKVAVTWKATRPADYNSSTGTTGIKVFANYTYGEDNKTGEYSKTIQITTLPIAPKNDAYLSDINWLSSANAWGPVEKDRSNGESASGDGNTITINGVKYTKGLGVHAVSTIDYHIGKNFSRFTAVVGIDDEVIGKTGTPTSIIFQVWGDGTKLWESPAMTAGDPAIPVDVDINGVKLLKLVATNGVDGINNDHGDWANAKIKAALKDVNLTTDKTLIGAKDTANLSVTGTVVSGEAADLSGAVKVFTSSDENIAVVDENGKVTAKGDGKATIKATVTKDGITREASIDITADVTAPTFDITGIKDGDAVKLNQDITVSWTAADNLSGVASASGDITSGSKLDTSKIGPNTLTFTATDNAGNIATKTITYNVQYVYSGVLEPINSDGSKIFKLGSTIPVKFQLKDAKDACVADATAKLYIAKVVDNKVGPENPATSTSAASEENKFRYDSASNQYIFNLSTMGLTAGTYQIRIDLADGTINTVAIELR